MSTYRPSDFPPFAVTVDIVVLNVSRGFEILTVRRGVAPYRGRIALPGGFVRAEESLHDAARRELAEETGLSGRELPGVHLEQLASFGGVKRDPRMRVVSVAYLALSPLRPEPRAGTDAAAARWLAVEEALSASLAFDHAEILTQAVQRVRAKLEYTTLATMLVGESFTLGELQLIYERIWGVALERANFRRKVLGTPGFVVATGERRTGSAGGAPAAVYVAGSAGYLSPPFTQPQD